MAKRRYTVTNKSIERRIKEGRGKGQFSEYKPWLTIHDVASLGVVTRILGWKSGRIHHFLSEHYELAHFLQMEWAENVIDVREQFPLLPLEKTLFIAETLGIKHPRDPKSQHPVVMTTDMLITVKSKEGIEFQAHSIKPSNKLTKRVVEKLEVERRFFEDNGVKWKLITEKEINYNLVKNIRWLHSAKTLYGMPHLTEQLIDEVEPQLLSALQTEEKACAKITVDQDRRLELPLGTCMFVLKHLIANRRWRVDMLKPINTSLESLGVERI
ncbi:TnsA endonuclease N-terminal domain-containing protein [Robertmurraya sp.]|uniref:TnsA endonuclease N-terminal domain-containing protein n=1 Tax=Robertmurraya sp. TaxID=2837525 RepID=UPI0037047763